MSLSPRKSQKYSGMTGEIGNQHLQAPGGCFCSPFLPLLYISVYGGVIDFPDGFVISNESS